MHRWQRTHRYQLTSMVFSRVKNESFSLKSAFLDWIKLLLTVSHRRNITWTAIYFIRAEFFTLNFHKHCQQSHAKENWFISGFCWKNVQKMDRKLKHKLGNFRCICLPKMGTNSILVGLTVIRVAPIHNFTLGQSVRYLVGWLFGQLTYCDSLMPGSVSLTLR